MKIVNVLLFNLLDCQLFEGRLLIILQGGPGRSSRVSARRPRTSYSMAAISVKRTRSFSGLRVRRILTTIGWPLFSQCERAWCRSSELQPPL